jgi:phenylalanyl-tRNA synthetase beta chain
VKVLVSWLRDLVDVPVAPDALARDLHMAGFEVASVAPVASPDGRPDAVIDFEITANRPDCLSLVGLAREVSTLYGTALRLPAGYPAAAADPASAGPLRVVIEDSARCPRYCAALADVRIAPSPAWMAARLGAAGLRSINNIVDITNYVLLELGHPLHAFDLATIGGSELRVRTARAGETLTTLDGQVRKLDDQMLVIADRERAQALAGVMGGRETEVTSATTAIAIESAWFLPTSIRRTSKRLGLSTEASYRFERGADLDAAPAALARACALIVEIGAGTIRNGWVDAYPAIRPRVRVDLSLDRVQRVLGVSIDAGAVHRILSGLGFEATARQPGEWTVAVPTWRVDVSRDVDLIEELARHFGYDRLPATFPALTVASPKPAPAAEARARWSRLACAAGFTEAVTFSFISEKAALEFAPPDTHVVITNPLSELFGVLRPSLLPGLVDAVAHNRRHGQRDVRLFELGTRFRKSQGEGRTLGLAWTGAATREHWSGRARPVDLFDLTGVVETFVRADGLTLAPRAATHQALTPGRTAELVVSTADGRHAPAGIAGLLLTALTTARDIPAQDEVFVAEIDLDALAALVDSQAIVRTAPLARFPSVVRDVSILVDDTLLAADVRGTIQAAAPSILARVAEFDRYVGKGVPDGKVSLSYRLTFQAPDRTLTDEDVDRATAAVVEALVTRHGATRR